MKAIILAAGVGKRLSAVAKGRPKCLIEIGGRTLLSRHVENLATIGVQHIVLVVGYQQNLIREAMQLESFPGTIEFVVNERFERGSITSLWEARDEFNDDVVIMDADVLYHPMILRRLVESSSGNALLMDETIRQQTEECMVAARGKRVIALSKTLPVDYDCAGEGVGFLKVRREDLPCLAQSVQTSIDNGRLDQEYEDAMKSFFDETYVGYERIGGLPWIEIDFPEDVQRAEQEVLPAVLTVEPEVVFRGQVD